MHQNNLLKIHPRSYRKAIIGLTVIMLASCSSGNTQKAADPVEEQAVEDNTVTFSYQEVNGIGKDPLYNRRDPSDVIKVGDTYYVWYTRMDAPIRSGYWGTIWYATSEDEGHTWKEQGMALGLGEKGTFDSHSVFTPNILAYEGKYYMYYTGVMPTPRNSNNEFENNSVNDITALGLAVADSPEGPFKRISKSPILEISSVAEDFDSYRIDDASMLVKEDKIWLYYKGRSFADGKEGPQRTKMGVAMAEHPTGPFTKHAEPILDKSHEVLIWQEEGGVASLASISESINLAPDGLHFSNLYTNLQNLPKAPGLYRPHLEDGNVTTKIPGWGISMIQGQKEAYLLRYEINKE